MAFAPNNMLRVAYEIETTPGLVPASPSWQVLRTTGPTGGPQKKVETSKEFTGSRAGRRTYPVAIDVPYTIPFEMSYGTFDEWMEAALRGAWTTDVLKDGTTAKFMSIEEADLDNGTSFLWMSGLDVDKFSLSLPSRGTVTGSIECKGMAATVGQTAKTGATYLPATTTEVMTTGAAVGAITLTGVTGQPIVKSAEISWNNGLEGREYLGSYYTKEPASSPLVIDLSMDVYFQDIELYSLFLAHTDIGVSLKLGKTTLQKYLINLPTVQVNDGSRERADLGKDQMLKLKCSVPLNSTLGATCSITRAVA